MAKATRKIYRGDTFKGVINLRLKDSCDANKVNPFAIEAGSVIEIRFKGATSVVVLSTANVGEVTILDANLSTISYEGAPAKSLLLKTGDDMTTTVVVTQGISTEVYTFEEANSYNCKDRNS